MTPQRQALPSIHVAELFTSIQGEGPSVGVPANFLRLQGCSVGCRWCDSRYTWNPHGGEQMTLNEIAAKFDEVGRVQMLVLTGGEALEHPNFTAIIDWASPLWRRIEVETSGVRRPPTVPINVTWNWSPKLSSVTTRADDTWSYAADFRASRNWVCKVVVESPQDWEEAVQRIAACELPPEHVLIMPQGTQSDELAERGRWLVPLCLRKGFRLSSRLHIHLWGPKRGV